jgi:hypothetical protein
VTAATIELLVSPVPARPDGWWFCGTFGCRAAYFRGAEVLELDAVGVPIFQKHTEPTRLVCYCFSHSVADVRAAQTESGNAIVASIIAACRHGRDRCDQTNPQGRCCLANVRAIASRGDGGPCC